MLCCLALSMKPQVLMMTTGAASTGVSWVTSKSLARS